MSQTKLVKCSNCGVFNTNKDYCENCGTLISHEKKMALKTAQVKQQQVAEEIYKIKNPNFVTRLRQHPNFIARCLGWLLYSVITVVSAIGAAIAWVVAMIAAG